MSDFIWLLYWKCREYEQNPELPVKIQLFTTDKQEWSLQIDVDRTTVEYSFRGEIDFFDKWGSFMQCSMTNKIFSGHCRRSKVTEVFKFFRESVQHCVDINPVVNLLNLSDKSLHYLFKWHDRNCFNHENYQGAVVIEAFNENSWRLSIDLSGTYLEGKFFSEIRIRRGDLDWFTCEVSDGKFHALTGLLNLPEALEVFENFCLRWDQ